jgi:aryl carrier-like protein
LSLLERSGCQTVLLPSRPPAIIKQILNARHLQTVNTPGVDFFMNNFDSVEPFPFPLTWEEAKNKPFCILHTSGSTGIPKPVFVTYGTFACNDAHQLIPLLGGKPTFINFLKEKRFFLALPLFHAACLTFSLGFNIFSGVTCVLPPPGPLTADIANQIFTYGNLDGALLAPSLIVDCYNNDAYCVNMIQRLKFLSYVGGVLPEEIGNPLSARIKLLTLMGSCETALHPLEINDDPADWQYLTISPFLGHNFRLERDGLYDLVIVRQQQYEPFQGVFSTFPDLQEFAMGDLFEPHPRRPESWVFKARTDDIIAFTTAEKLNPITMETVISANPKVKSAVIGGQGEFQASLLLEPQVYPKTTAKQEQFIKEIWPSIAQANRDCPAHGRIMKGFVMLSNPDKPMPRTAKDTVQRHAVLKLYADEFKALYNNMRPHISAVSNTVHSVFKTPSDARKPHVTAKEPALESSRASPVSLSHCTEMHAPADLDARVEEALSRILPGALANYLQMALTQTLSNFLSTNQPNQTPIQSSKPATTTTTTTNKQPLTNGHSTDARKNTFNATPPFNISQVQYDPISDLRKLMYDTLADNLVIENITDDSDLFQCGLDSVQVPELLNALNAFVIKFKPGVDLIDAKVVYDNPTVNKLMSILQ